MDPNMASTFYKGMTNIDGNMGAAKMNGMRPPSSHPGQQFTGPMNPQLMAARQQQQAQQQGGQGGPPVQWPPAGGPNGNQMAPQASQGQQVQGTPTQRAVMPPPSAPAAAGANQRNQTVSPQTTNAAPPTPQPSTKAGPKKKDTKASKSKVFLIPISSLFPIVRMSVPEPLN